MLQNLQIICNKYISVSSSLLWNLRHPNKVYVGLIRHLKSIWYICSHLEIQSQHISGVIEVVGPLGTPLHIWSVCYISLSMALSSGCKGSGPTPLYQRGFLPIKTTSCWRVPTSMKNSWVRQNAHRSRYWQYDPGHSTESELGTKERRCGFSASCKNMQECFLLNMFHPKASIAFWYPAIGL